MSTLYLFCCYTWRFAPFVCLLKYEHMSHVKLVRHIIRCIYFYGNYEEKRQTSHSVGGDHRSSWTFAKTIKLLYKLYQSWDIRSRDCAGSSYTLKRMITALLCGINRFSETLHSKKYSRTVNNSKKAGYKRVRLSQTRKRDFVLVCEWKISPV